jgi:hypothetical protein
MSAIDPKRTSQKLPFDHVAGDGDQRKQIR